LNSTEINRALATETLLALHAAGVGTICICPGGRNAPLVMACAAARESFDIISFFEERSAGFFAAGRIRRDGAPVAVITTSGTAAAELLPAMLEAHYSGLPLIAVTADRPRHLRGTGAPQTVEQPPLFASCRPLLIDADAPGQIGVLPAINGPVHINICFGEPLLDGAFELPDLGHPPARHTPQPWMDEATAGAACDDFFRSVRNPLVMVSSLDQHDAKALAPWLASLECPLYLEAVSQLRSRKNLQEFSLHSGERILLTTECRRAIDGILRVGGVPTPGFWRGAEAGNLPVLHISRLPFPGMGRLSPVVPIPHFVALADRYAIRGGENEPLFERDRKTAAAWAGMLHAEPRSEAGLVQLLADKLPPAARVFLGNSQPIREWDLVAPRHADERIYYANRGVNGIDGLVSSALGLAGTDRPAAAVLGDLSAMYDLAGLWPAAQLPGGDFTLAVINNGGGMIFDRMFKHPAFLNPHALQLRGWAEMFGWHYGLVRSAHDPWPSGTPRLIEVIPDAAATKRLAECSASLWR
jgi:2-succinyl-5-enolpyruvyl-6-hydroxy-3-cyclohexene-1-carboxylate synthase